MTTVATSKLANVTRAFELVTGEVSRTDIRVASITINDWQSKATGVSVQVREFAEAVTLATLFGLTFRRYDRHDAFEGEWMGCEVIVYSTEDTPIDGYGTADCESVTL